MHMVLLLSSAAALMAFQNPPGPDGQPRPTPSAASSPVPTPSPSESPQTTPSPSISPSPTPTPSATPSTAPTPPINDQSPEAKDAGDSGVTQGDDQPPKPRA